MLELLAMWLSLVPVQGNERLKPLDYLIGSWEGKGQYLGHSFTDSITYEWCQNKKFIRYRYLAKSGKQTVWSEEGYYAWDSDRGKIVGFLFGRDGSLGHSVAVKSPKSNLLVMEGSVSGGGGCHLKKWRIILKKRDQNYYTVVYEKKKGAKYEPLMKIEYRRIR